MKRWLVALLVLLAVIVLVSPGIIGRLAEQNLKDGITGGGDGNGEYVVTEERFERGWFTTAGRHRIEFRSGAIHDALSAMTDRRPEQPAPALIVDTRIDHGLVPVTSMSRESGTLKPSLASTVSTMQLDPGAGQPLDVPGILYSEVGLNGETASRYLLKAGVHEDATTTVTWDGVDVRFTTDPASRSLTYEGHIKPFNIRRSGDSARLEDDAHFSGTVDKTPPGLPVGALGLTIGAATVEGGFGRIRFDAVDVRIDSRLGDDGRLAGRSSLELDGFVLPAEGEAVDLHAEVALEGLDARALQAVLATVRERDAAPAAPQDTDPPAIDNDLRQLLSAGGKFRVDRFDMTTADGELEARLRFELPETEGADTWSWASLLLALTASAEVELAAGLVERAIAANPDVRSLIAMGILERDGDIYALEAQYAQGLLTVNGAPVPIPLPERRAR